jgi:tRNA G46 methylase TrmB
MPLQTIDIPDDIKQLSHSTAAAELIALATDRIEAFMSTQKNVTENFVRCDFQLVDHSLTWIQQNHLLTGNRFCELGSGFGVAALLASLRDMESVGIEIEPYLVDQANQLAEAVDLPAEFYCGSFVPRGILDIVELGSEVEHVETHEDDVFNEIGVDMDEFDLFFAFPWPGEEHFFESVFQAAAADNSLLLTYRGRDGMHLCRKS